MGVTSCTTGQTRIVLELRLPDDVAQRTPHPVRVGADHEIATVAGGECPISRDRFMAASLWSRYPSGSEIVRRLVGKHGDLAVQHRNVDQLAYAGVTSLFERREDADYGIHARADVGEWNAGTHGLAALFSRQAHATGQRLHRHVVGGTEPIRPILAETGNGAIDQSRIEF